MLPNLYLSALVFLLIGNDSNIDSEQVYFGQKFILGQNQQVSITDSTATGEAITLSWESMTDSRCPTDVKCITAGEAVLILQLQNKDLQTILTKVYQPGTSPAITYITNSPIQLGKAKYNLRLLSVSPYPNTKNTFRMPQAELILEKI
ncbi:hypothetical protein [Pontibacter vulgaris]|uniref:hypothetical protein n=1 Tax=Pontibacter vulgaris TaxID=2905679 RepID=UPI001FA7A5F4|nr:hypothetical protein [Pontibacter vulgaris]